MSHTPEQIADPPLAAAVEDALREAAERLARLQRENESMAEEVLRNYEQLSVIFDFAQQAAQRTRAAQIESQLLQKLHEQLQVDHLHVWDGTSLEHYSVVRSSAFMPDEVPEEELLALCEESTGTGQVTVRSAGGQRILIAPLPGPDGAVRRLLAGRAPGRGDFTSVDVRMAESLIAFAGSLLASADLHARLRTMSIETTRALVAAIEKKDRYTSGHSERVCRLSSMIGAALALSHEQLELLEWSALLHDVGKIGVPEELLNKPGALTDAEFAMIRRHPEMGCEILRPIHSFSGILDGVLHHHENHDGSGYPAGLAGDAIPQFARIIHVADVFDALSSTRSYRRAFTVDNALGIIRAESGTKLDPIIADTFLRVIEEFRRTEPEAFDAMYPPPAAPTPEACHAR